MSRLSEFTEQLRQKKHLDEASASEAAAALARPADEVPFAEKKAFLRAFHAKGETVAEVAAFARYFRSVALDPQLGEWAGRGIDIVGTGGSGSSGYNVSSVSAMIVAAGGVPVLKHGNRAITSSSGAADFLSELGIPLQADPAMLRRSLEELNFCFFFAPGFHPAFKEIMPVRKELAAEGQRTIFNILGPLINPAKPANQLLGVFRPQWVGPLARALTSVGVRRGLAVCCELREDRFMDEFASVGRNEVAGIGELEGFRLPELRDLDLELGDPGDLAGGTAAENVAILDQLMKREARPALADTICLNAGAAFFIARKSDSVREGVALAREILTGGTLSDWIRHTQSFYAELSE